MDGKGVLGSLVLLLASAGIGMETAAAEAVGERALPPAAAAPADDGTWPMAAKNYASTRYSELDQIDARDVRDLQVAMTFSTGVLRGHEAAPIVVNDTMYVVTPFPNYVYALDLGKPGAPVKWKYEPKAEASAQGVACCDTVNRGAAYADRRIFFNTLDNHTIALDAASGRELWNSKLGDINSGETITMAPLVVKGKVLVGNSGGEYGVRGWLTALDAGTGKIAWRAFSTGSDEDVLIGPEFKPFYEQDRGQDLGIKTWPPDTWRIGGGTVWGWISYDPELDLIYYGTGNPGLGIRISGPETTSGPSAFSPEIRTTAGRTGSIRPSHTICMIMTASTS
jgi:PQQ-dependent dehydrogenase (methanol/ethanol family)